MNALNQIIADFSKLKKPYVKKRPVYFCQLVQVFSKIEKLGIVRVIRVPRQKKFQSNNNDGFKSKLKN